MPEHVSDLSKFQELIAGDKTVAVDFTATWCPPCKMIGPIFEGYAAEYPNAVFIKVDVDEAHEIASKYEISAMPTFQFFKNGTMVDELVGADKNQLKSLCEKHCK